MFSSYQELCAEWEAMIAPKKKDRQLVISKFDAVNRPAGVSGSTSWSDVVAHVMDGHIDWTAPKDDAWLINFVEFTDDYRNDVNAKRMDALMIDYDDGMSLEDAKERFKDYEYVLFTSYSHQIHKYKPDGSVKDTPKDKFRMIFPFETVCEYDDWVQINEAVMQFAPDCDPACKKISQCYTYNFTHPDNQHLAVINHNTGKYVDWREWDKNPEKKSEYIEDGDYEAPTEHQRQYVLDELKFNAEFNNDRDAWFKAACGLKEGGYTLGDFANISMGASATDSKKMWDSIKVRNVGYNMGTVWNLIGGHKQYWETHPEQRVQKEAEPLVDMLLGIKTRSDERKKAKESFTDIHEVEDAWSRAERSEKLTSSIGNIVTGRHLLMAGEGYGKSNQAVVWANADRRLLFTCLSNEQAEEQAETFRRRGITVQLLTGTAYNLAQKGIEVVRHPDINPWQIGNIDEEQTIIKIMDKLKCKEDDAITFYDLHKPPHPNFNEAQIVVTTHARVSGWGSANNKVGDSSASYVPHDVTIIIDDPSANQFKRLTPYDERFVNCKIGGQDIEQTERGKYQYFVKPDRYTLGFGFERHMTVFTTTEFLIGLLMEEVYPELITHDLMQERVFSGNISLFKTVLTSSRYDAILPCMMHRIQRRIDDEIIYIANGQGMQHNLISTKGQNRFTNNHIVIEISEAPLNVIHQWCHELDWDENQAPLVKAIIALDEMQQAIGRNRGYRWKDRVDAGDDYSFVMIVLCAPRLFENMNDLSRYHFTDLEDLDNGIIDRNVPDKLSITKNLKWLVGNVGQYMDEGMDIHCRKDRPELECDIAGVYKTLKGTGKHVQFYNRVAKLSKTLKDYTGKKKLFYLNPIKCKEIGLRIDNTLEKIC